jgi:uncharacterized protein YjbI with pentapeptide repeats
MISSKITIELFPAEGRQWASITLDGADDPHLVLAEAVKALGMEISRLYAHGASAGSPLDLGGLEALARSEGSGPVSVSNLLGISDTLPQDIIVDDVEPAPLQASPTERERAYELAREWKARGGQESLQAFDLSGQDLNGIDLSGADLGQSNLEGANLQNANLAGANLSEAILSVANLNGANLKQANLSQASLVEVALSQANLDGADLDEADLTESTLNRTSLIGATLVKAVLSQANLIEANLNETSLVGANLAEQI